jgi:aryl-alcohol dehydrogenase (NADP+)
MLGSTGLKLSVIGLGALTFGREVDEQTAHALLDHYVDSGGNFIDTADIYAKGRSESFVGSWLTRSSRRDKVIIATKVGHRSGTGPNDVGLTSHHILESVEESLRKLHVETIDLYQAHVWDNLTPVEETLRAFDLLVQQGKVRYIGVSNFSGWQLSKSLMTSRVADTINVVSVQSQYNLLERGIEWEIIPLALAEDLAVLPWSPLGGGWLTGKYRPGVSPSEGTRLGEDRDIGSDSWVRRDSERTWQILGTVQDIAATHAVTPAQVSINWLLQKPAVVSSIIGIRTLTQLKDNFHALTWTLDDNEMARLDAVSDPGTPYPYSFIQRNTRE